MYPTTCGEGFFTFPSFWVAWEAGCPPFLVARVPAGTAFTARNMSPTSLHNLPGCFKHPAPLKWIKFLWSIVIHLVSPLPFSLNSLHCAFLSPPPFLERRCPFPALHYGRAISTSPGVCQDSPTPPLFPPTRPPRIITVPFLP